MVKEKEIVVKSGKSTDGNRIDATDMASDT